MDLSRLSLATKLITGAAILLLIDLFLSWQQFCVSFQGVGGGCVGRSGWHGLVGVVLGILVIALIAWQVLKILGVELPELPLPDAQIELAVIAGVVVFTILKFLTANEVRHWWVQIVGLVCAAAIAYGGWLRMQGQVDAPAAASSAPAAPAAPAAPSYTPPPAAPAEPAAPADESADDSPPASNY